VLCLHYKHYSFCFGLDLGLDAMALTLVLMVLALLTSLFSAKVLNKYGHSTRPCLTPFQFACAHHLGYLCALIALIVTTSVFTIGPLGPWPPFDLRKILHRAKNATLEKLSQLFLMFPLYT